MFNNFFITRALKVRLSTLFFMPKDAIFAMFSRFFITVRKTTFSALFFFNAKYCRNHENLQVFTGFDRFHRVLTGFLTKNASENYLFVRYQRWQVLTGFNMFLNDGYILTNAFHTVSFSKNLSKPVKTEHFSRLLQYYVLKRKQCGKFRFPHCFYIKESKWTVQT